MTIADNLTALANQKLGYQDSVEACKTSLINKDVVVPVGAKLADISGLIDEIQQDPSIPVGTGQHLVTFYDFDGKVLKRQRVNTDENATAPAIPTHQYLTFAEWNNPFTNVQSDIDTGAIYNTTDGKTYMFITLTPVTGLAPTLYFYKSSTSLMTIDWGDGTTSTSTTSGSQTINHVYATAGDYIITVDNSAGGTYKFGHTTITTTCFYGYANILTKIYLGFNIDGGNYQFFFHNSLSYVSIGTYLTTYGANAFQSNRLKHLNVNSQNKTADFYGMNYIKKIVDNYLKTNIKLDFYNCYSIQDKLIFKSVIAIEPLAFQNCYNITQYIFLSTTPPTLANINAFSGINPICKIYVPDASVTAYKTATNWSFYANYIYPLSEKPQSDE